MNEIPLGFGPSPRATYVYVSSEKSDTGWYMWDNAKGAPIPIEQPALTGFVTGIDLGEKEHKGKKNPKLRLSVSAGPRNYVVETGLYSSFARCIMGSLVKLSLEQLSEPISIEPQRGNEEKVMFADVYLAKGGERIQYEWPKSDSDVDQMYATLSEMLDQRSGGQVKPKADPRQQGEPEIEGERQARPAQKRSEASAPAAKAATKQAPAPKPQSQLMQIEDSDEGLKELISYIRTAGPMLDGSETFEYNGTESSIKKFVADNWSQMKTNFAMTRSVAVAMEEETKVEYHPAVGV